MGRDAYKQVVAAGTAVPHRHGPPGQKFFRVFLTISGVDFIAPAVRAKHLNAFQCE
jgi:hypothetical protein